MKRGQVAKIKLEDRMLNVIKTNPVEKPTGKYLAALGRLEKRGLVVVRGGVWIPTPTIN